MTNFGNEATKYYRQLAPHIKYVYNANTESRTL